jgi:hypothetical protein
MPIRLAIARTELSLVVPLNRSVSLIRISCNQDVITALERTGGSVSLIGPLIVIIISSTLLTCKRFNTQTGTSRLVESR